VREGLGESTGGLVILREEEPLGWVMWVKVKGWMAGGLEER
jgi:hypothetical protein